MLGSSEDAFLGVVPSGIETGVTEESLWAGG